MTALTSHFLRCFCALFFVLGFCPVKINLVAKNLLNHKDSTSTQKLQTDFICI